MSFVPVEPKLPKLRVHNSDIAVQATFSPPLRKQSAEVIARFEAQCWRPGRRTPAAAAISNLHHSNSSICRYYPAFLHSSRTSWDPSSKIYAGTGADSPSHLWSWHLRWRKSRPVSQFLPLPPPTTAMLLLGALSGCALHPWADQLILASLGLVKLCLFSGFWLTGVFWLKLFKFIILYFSFL